jgi:hypothetical protein
MYVFNLSREVAPLLFFNLQDNMERFKVHDRRKQKVLSTWYF